MEERQQGSRISGFYKLHIEDRLNKLNQRVELSVEEFAALRGSPGLRLDQAERFDAQLVGAARRARSCIKGNPSVAWSR